MKRVLKFIFLPLTGKILKNSFLSASCFLRPKIHFDHVKIFAVNLLACRGAQ